MLTKDVQMSIVVRIDFVEKKKKSGSKSSDTALVSWSAKSVVSRRQLAFKEGADVAAEVWSSGCNLQQVHYPVSASNNKQGAAGVSSGCSKQQEKEEERFFVAMLGAWLPPPLQSALTPTMRLHLLLNNCRIWAEPSLLASFARRTKDHQQTKIQKQRQCRSASVVSPWTCRL